MIPVVVDLEKSVLKQVSKHVDSVVVEVGQKDWKVDQVVLHVVDLVLMLWWSVEKVVHHVWFVVNQVLVVLDQVEE